MLSSIRTLVLLILKSLVITKLITINVWKNNLKTGVIWDLISDEIPNKKINNKWRTKIILILKKKITKKNIKNKPPDSGIFFSPTKSWWASPEKLGSNFFFIKRLFKK